MPKPFLILQIRPEDDVTDSEFEAILRVGSIPVENTRRIRIETNGIPDIDLTAYAGVIVGGSPYDISTPESEKQASQHKIEADFQRLFSHVIPADIPFLGMCSGNGLLGNYLGASISKKYGEPAGGVDIMVTQAGRDDPLLQAVPETFRAFAGHKEACDSLPAGAVLLATNQACPVQMFRVGRNVYATQFHPEADAEAFIVRIEAYQHSGYFEPENARALIDQVSNERIVYAQYILRNFIRRYRQY